MAKWMVTIASIALVPLVVCDDLCKQHRSARGGEEIVCHSLTSFNLSPNRAHRLSCINCTLPTLENSSFQIAKNNISSMYLISSKIRAIKDFAFSKFKLRVLNLRNNSIADLATKSFANLTRLSELDLSRNQIRILTNNLFGSLRNLNLLNLKHNTIYYLQPDAFKGLSTLKHLYMSDNLIEKLDRDVFKHLPDLFLLHLDNNNILEIDSFAFTNLQNLNALYLNNNSIGFLTQYNFKPLTNLADLQLRGNELSEIQTSAFNGLTNLRSLSLGNNRLKAVKAYGFVGLDNLHNLELINNAFETFDLNWVQHMKNLRAIWLEQNRLSNLSIDLKQDSLESLYSLGLSDNNLTTISYRILFNKVPNVRDIFVDNNTWGCEFLVNMFNFFQEKRVNLCVSADCNVNATMRYVEEICVVQKQAEDDEKARDDVGSDFVKEIGSLRGINFLLLAFSMNVIFV